MCCLFGIVDYKGVLTKRQKTALTRSLAKAAEERGTDAAGIAFNVSGHIQIDKHGIPAHNCHFSPSRKAPVIMGHTRFATQGSPTNNKNNHPFYGKSTKPFALAHNGVLYNDYSIRKSYNLPYSPIETDSFIAVQLLEMYGGVSFDSLKNMAETVSGSFVFTVLDSRNRLYIVKGDNPLTLYKYPENVYVYASTKTILEKGLKRSGVKLEKPTPIDIVDGDILRINRDGSIDYDVFKMEYDNYYYPYGWGKADDYYIDDETDTDLYSILYQEAEKKGYTKYYIDFLLDSGYSIDDICDKIYNGERDIF